MILKKNKPVILLLQHFLKRWMGILLICWLPMTFSGYAKADQVISDLKVLSLVIEKQSQEIARTGRPNVAQQLLLNQDKLNQALLLLRKRTTRYSDIEQILKDGQAISANIDIIVKHQKSFEDLYTFHLTTAIEIPGIQAEYNLMTDYMARHNYPSDQVVIAKNQVFVAERILKSLISLSQYNESARYDLEDLSEDIETFSIYLEAQLEGKAELGVIKIKDAVLRESLLSIQQNMDAILNVGSNNILHNSESFLKMIQVINDNITQSNALFNALEKLD